MIEGIVRIYMSYVEPEDRNLLWMRPYLDKEGYEILFYGSTGWTKWLPCCDNNIGNTKEECTGLLEIPCKEQ